MSKADLRDEHAGAFMARLAEYSHGKYIESDIERAKAEGYAEATSTTLSTRPIALTEDGRDPAGIALEEILESIHEKHPLGTRVRVTVEVVHRQPGERGGIDDL